tara:strand:- start:1374 stop:1973 length:600 start_codon:yes stop_codon:yes gene_type:complete
MYKKIINPNNGKAMRIDQPGGIKVLKKYLEVIDMQNGGDDNKNKNKSDTGVEKVIKKKGTEAIDEMIDGPKEVSNFFGKKIKSGFAYLFGLKKQYPGRRLTALDKDMIKNIFDSDESNNADKKFASAKAAQLAANSGHSVEEIAIALFVLQRKRTSDRGWTKMEVEIGIKYIESWNNKHKKQWPKKIKEIKKKFKNILK